MLVRVQVNDSRRLQNTCPSKAPNCLYASFQVFPAGLLIQFCAMGNTKSRSELTKKKHAPSVATTLGKLASSSVSSSRANLVMVTVHLLRLIIIIHTLAKHDWKRFSVRDDKLGY